MELQERIYQTLVADPAWSALITPQDVYEASAVPDDVRPMYAALLYGELTPEPGGWSNVPFELWVHDAPGSYDRIRAALKLARPVLTAAAGPLTDGWLVETRYEGQSEDSYDDGTATIFRTDRFRVYGTGMQ